MNVAAEQQESTCCDLRVLRGCRSFELVLKREKNALYGSAIMITFWLFIGRLDMSSNREIQKVQLGLLEAVDALCCKHGIRYTLYYNTLLGAIRYEGFAPWDDFIDIAMPLDDYERFLEVAHELPETYVVRSPKDSPHLTVVWAKAFINGTTCMPAGAAGIDTHWGISVDIFPFIGQEKGFLKRKLQSAEIEMAKYLRALEYVRTLSLEVPGAGAIKTIGKKMLGMLPFGPRIALSNWLLARAMRDPSTSTRIGTVDAARFGGKFAQSDWAEMSTAVFEGREYPVPADYERVLQTIYGDSLKQLEKVHRVPRMRREGVVIRDSVCDYREYQRMLSEQMQ